MPRAGIGNFPSDATNFVGRRAELAVVRDALAAQRVVTLIGPGGVGKTRLAVELASAVRDEFPDGVWLVELATIRAADLVGQAVSDVFGLRDESRDPVGTLAEFIRDKRLLLVLDNCEHLAEACAGLVATLIARAKSVRVLVTSRQVLGIAGEQVMSIPPLPVPDTELGHSFARSDSVTLFVDRARLAVPGFELTAENSDLVARLCRRLDGIPLALELAAMRLRTIPLGEVVTRLDDMLRLLVRGGRARPERQQTLRATVDWSYQLCSPAEQAAWQRLSVFAGGFTLAAAEQVCSDDDPDLVGLLEGLVDKSVVGRNDPLTVHRGRYHMLEVLRQYGAERLAESDQEASAWRAHARYSSDLAQRGDTENAGPGDVEWFRTVRDELPNIRAAMEFLLTQSGEEEQALRTATALRPYWIHTAGVSREGLSWLRRALDRCPESSRERVRAVSMIALLACLRGETSLAGGALAEARVGALQIEPADDLVDVELMLVEAMYTRSCGDLEKAIELAEQAAERSMGLSHSAAGLEALLAGSTMAIELGDDGRARQLATALVTSSQERGATLMRANACWISGLLDLRSAQDVEGARAQLRESIALFRQFPAWSLAAIVLGPAADVAADVGDLERAAALFGAANRMWIARHTPLSRDVGEHMTGIAQSSVQRRLGQTSFDRAVARGAELSDEEALDLAADALAGVGSVRDVTRFTGGDDGLTARQWEVARLVGQGLSNKEIADRLVISERTAEAHVANILARTDFRSRSQIAVWISQRDGYMR